MCSCAVALAGVSVDIFAKRCKRALHRLLFELGFWAEWWKGGQILQLLDFSLDISSGPETLSKVQAGVR